MYASNMQVIEASSLYGVAVHHILRQQKHGKTRPVSAGDRPISENHKEYADDDEHPILSPEEKEFLFSE